MYCVVNAGLLKAVNYKHKVERNENDKQRKEIKERDMQEHCYGCVQYVKNGEKR